MRKLMVTTLVLMGLSGSAWAETINASVNGMVCAFCVTGIEKSFQKNEAVEAVKVDLEKQLVTINTKAGKTIDDDTIKKIIANSGYDCTQIDRVNQ